MRAMKGKAPIPLWLICDVSACMRLHIALGLLAVCILRFMPKRSTRPVTSEGIAWLTVWQATAEALLRWAIARHAFRLCGLDPKQIRIQLRSEAKDSFAWQIRTRTFIHIYETMTACARRLARRIRAAQAARSASCGRPPSLAPSPLSIPRCVLPAFSLAVCAVTPAGQRIRAPPWPASTHQTHRPRLAGSPARSRAFVRGPTGSNSENSHKPLTESFPAQGRE